LIEIPGTEYRIKAKTAWNADTLRGDYSDLLILDEWQLMNEDAWEFVGAPMLLDNDGDAIFLFTPPSLHSRSVSKAKDLQHASKMYEKYRDDETGRWATFHWTSHDNPTLSNKALLDITKDMTSIAYNIEIMAQDIDQAPGALWKKEDIEHNRVFKAPELSRIVVGVDPSTTSGGDEAGIITAGRGGEDGYVLSDDSIQGSPLVWATAAVTAFHKFKADRIVAECVPIDSEALTKEGWKPPVDLRVGDHILGYDLSTDTCKWTKIIALNFGYDEVITYGNSSFHVRCTRNHKWPMRIESRAGRAKYGKRLKCSKKTQGMFTIDEMLRSWRRARMIQCVPADIGSGIVIAKFTDWIDRNNAVRKVLQMSRQQRIGFIYGMLLGEGTLTKCGGVQFSQNPGAINDAFLLACFLEGVPASHCRINRKKWNGEDRISYRTWLHRSRTLLIEKVQELRSKSEEVWCPTTQLETWVMRQDERITITGNSNNGGEMVELTIKQVDHSIPVKLVHASRGKFTRAEPIAANYEKGRVHHVGKFDALEREQCLWIPGDPSPNRMDAAVWALTELLLRATPGFGFAGRSYERETKAEEKKQPSRNIRDRFIDRFDRGD